MIPAGGAVVQHNITTAAASQGVFPIQHRKDLLCHHILKDDYRFLPPPSRLQRMETTTYHYDGEQRHCNPQQVQCYGKYILYDRIVQHWPASFFFHLGTVYYTSKKLQSKPHRFNRKGFVTCTFRLKRTANIVRSPF